MRYPTLLVLITVGCCSAYATTIPQTVTPANATELGYLTCPPTNLLIKDQKTMYWATKENGFRSYDVSFAEHINRFLGAQWEGVNLGTVYCLYQGDRMAFNITVQFHALSYTPVGGRWSNNLGGYRNCISNNINDCFFKPYVTKKTNLYKELDSVRPTHSSSMGF